MTLDPHIPVLLDPILTRAAPIRGTWLDGTFGAGGYTRALLEAGAGRVIAVDRDPSVLAEARDWAGDYGDRLVLVEGNFQDLDRVAADTGALPLDGVVLDVGVSSMQLDRSERGFSFMQDGPLDMRMAQTGTTAADLVNTLPERELADVLFQYGEERAARRIARAIVADRKAQPFTRTRQLAGMIERILPRPRPGQPHPATRTFQALRIAVNDELGALARGLLAAERALAEGGILAVVTFHSLEDRIVKRFLRARSGQAEGGSRHMPAAAPAEAARFKLLTRKAVAPEEGETHANPRARSAKLRMAARTAAPAGRIGLDQLGLPPLGLTRMEEKG
ncbi:16S rRNA (cytosine(1402)-N(4))-methyltransferase RsmH [Rhodobacteraceae bacterium 2CG4]|uniref:Ribosomal RNA small subunit methyltransferase H n=1 Tax=Halovulum marinum TaxID=2662447 RepID=A0A6L5YZV4_9RHOB|nr:16S rRNA (cytosine(1402)-N(4))-methyltransferase RsmH [Halovulum marinum]MSU89801.1 16S rRNA (cytosine(1402)-N(4))-methyltransferase RsmH [Halovulum marinum]